MSCASYSASHLQNAIIFYGAPDLHRARAHVPRDFFLGNVSGYWIGRREARLWRERACHYLIWIKINHLDRETEERAEREVRELEQWYEES